MKLYAFSLDGIMFYTTGILTNDQINIIEHLISEPISISIFASKEDSLKELLKKIENVTNIKLTILPISHVFRFDFL